MSSQWRKAFHDRFSKSQDSLDENFGPIFDFIETLLLNQRKELREAIRTFEGSSPDWMDFEREEVLKIFDNV